MEEKGARVVVVKGVRNIKYFLIASSLPCVAAIQQSLHEDYELTQGKQLKRSRALYIYIYIYSTFELKRINSRLLFQDPWAGLDRKDKGDARIDLRSRGLCLVPISCTPQIYHDNAGSDYWTPTYRECLYR